MQIRGISLKLAKKAFFFSLWNAIKTTAAYHWCFTYVTFCQKLLAEFKANIFLVFDAIQTLLFKSYSIQQVWLNFTLNKISNYSFKIYIRVESL